jgi:MFS family permease
VIVPRPQRRASRPPAVGHWIVVVLVLVLLTEQGALALVMTGPILPRVAVLFRTTQVVWVVTVFLLAAAVSTPILGKLADRFGKRRVLLIATAISAAGALVSAAAPSFGVLLVGRALGGVALAFIPLSYSLMRDIFPKRQLAIGIAVVANGLGLVAVGGPFIAGYLTDHGGVRSVFWLMLALLVVGGILVRLLVAETPVRVATPIDWWGGLLLALGFGGVMLAVSQGQAWGWHSARILVCVIGGGVILLAAMLWETRTPEPLLDLKRVRRAGISRAVLAAALGNGAIAVVSVVLPLMLQTPRSLAPGYGFSASVTDTAVYITSGGICSVLAGFFVGATARTLGFRRQLVLGCGFAAIGTLLLAFLHGHAWQIVCFDALVGFGAIVYAAMPNAVVASVPVDQQAVTAGTAATIVLLAGTVMEQVAFSVLAAHVGTVVHGLPIYTESGFRIAFIIAAACAGAGAVAAIGSLRGARSLRSSGLKATAVATRPRS